jgi:glycosyltransferase involved in cell wall biosynthesis
MNPDVYFNRIVNEFNYLGAATDVLAGDYSTIDSFDQLVPELLFITSFPPRECGIATYTQDLISALTQQFEPTFKCSICALESANEKHTYKIPPALILNTDCRNAFIKTAFHINNNPAIKLVVMQHEFGFFAKNEEEFKQLFESITKPIVVVFHTVLPNPAFELQEKVQAMSEMASAIIVMTTNAAKILQQAYHVSPYKINVIQHGTHLVPPLSRETLKKEFAFSNRKVLATFGLLSSSKSIETTLNALPKIIENHPTVLFLVLGKTHPSLVKQEGEKYREMLEEKVEELQLQAHVVFINEYLQLPILLEYLQLSDIYLFTSKDPNQAVSGTFSYAVSCGCPVVSTPIPHAKEIIAKKNGLMIDFENSLQLSEAVNSLLSNDALRSEISSNSFQKMAATAWQNSAIAHAILFQELTDEAFALHYKIPAMNLSHIQKMTTSMGMIQFSKIAVPDIHSGYTIDDNARALIAICQHYELTQHKHDLSLITTYLSFLKRCWQPSSHQFLNYVNEAGQFTQQNFNENLEDSNGRAIWALGYVCSLKNSLPINLVNEADHLLEKSLHQINRIHSTRAMAFIVKGLHYQNKLGNIDLLVLFTNRLVQQYLHESTNDWKWFESYLTYGNSLLPEALLCAFLSTGNETYKSIAKESFDFLLSKIVVDGKLKVISNKGWHLKNQENSSVEGGEQPIDVAYTLLTLEKFNLVWKNSGYKSLAKLAFNWFLGQNHLNQIVYNPCTGGCYDGIEEQNVNINQGAESTLSYLMARLAIERLFLNENTPIGLHKSNAKRASIFLISH